MKPIKSFIVSTRRSIGTRCNQFDQRLRVGAKDEKEAKRLVQDYCKRNNLMRSVHVYYEQTNKTIAYKTIIDDLTKEVLC